MKSTLKEGHNYLGDNHDESDDGEKQARRTSTMAATLKEAEKFLGKSHSKKKASARKSSNKHR